MICIIMDTETSGLPLDFDAPVWHVDNWPRIYQLAWEVVNDVTGETLNSFNGYVRSDGWVIPDTEFHRERGITTAFLEKNGYPMSTLLTDLQNAFEKCDRLVVHNMAFDSKVLGAEMYRYGVAPKKILDKFCTKEKSTYICKIPSPYKHIKDYKWPTLDEAYRHFYGHGFENAHDAMADVTACKFVYAAILKWQRINS